MPNPASKRQHLSSLVRFFKVTSPPVNHHISADSPDWREFLFFVILHKKNPAGSRIRIQEFFKDPDVATQYSLLWSICKISGRERGSFPKRINKDTVHSPLENVVFNSCFPFTNNNSQEAPRLYKYCCLLTEMLVFPPQSPYPKIVET